MPFKVEVKKDDWRGGQHALSITSNGYQWMTFSDLSPEQLLKIEKACHNYLSRLTKRAPDLKRAARKSKQLSNPAASSG